MTTEYTILKNNFAGRKGYTLHLDPNSQKAKRLLSGGFIEETNTVKPAKKKKRSKKVVEPAETKA